MDTELLQGYTTAEKEAYIGAIASIATVDRTASKPELEYLSALTEATGVHAQIAEAAAKDQSNQLLPQYLDALKSSDLRFALITDIIAFAKADGKYSLEEQQKITEISSYLGISHQQSDALNEVVEKSNKLEKSQETPANEGFFERNGLSGILKNANIPVNSILKGLLGVAAPLMISKMMSGRSGYRTGLGGGMGGGLLSSLLGGGSGMGISSMLGNLSGGRGYGGLGSILSRALHSRQRA